MEGNGNITCSSLEQNAALWVPERKESPHEPEVPPLGIHHGEMKTVSMQKPAHKGSQQLYLSKLSLNRGGIHNLRYTRTMEQHLETQRNEHECTQQLGRVSRV